MCKASQVSGAAGGVRSDIESRTRGIAVLAATAVATTDAAAEPSRRPAHSGGGRSPTGALVTLTSAAASAA